MIEAVFRYKCRLCGERFDGAHTSPSNAQHYLLHAVYGFRLGGTLGAFCAPKLIESHSCVFKHPAPTVPDQTGAGVADLIGYFIRGEDD